VKRLWIRSRGCIRALDVDGIDWVEADAKYSFLHAGDGVQRIRESIGAIEERLDPRRFVRVHRSAIVDVERIVGIETIEGRSIATLESGARVPISRSGRARVLALIGVAADPIQRTVRKSIYAISRWNESTIGGNEGR
jgi:two-component system, LytTR family, response regulator